MPTADEIAIMVGLDVGKTTHHLVALDRHGRCLLDRPVPNAAAVLTQRLRDLQAQGPVLVVVDQPASIGALPVAIARELGLRVGYLPGLTMRRLADIHPGMAKTDARDARIIAETARTLPDTIRALDATDALVAELALVCGFDDDLAQQWTAASNRLRGLLTQIHPALERVLGPNLERHGVLALLQRYPTPHALAQAGPRRIATFLQRHGGRQTPALATAIVAAIAEQTVVVPGTRVAGELVARQAAQLALFRDQRTAIAAQVDALVSPHPLCPVLISLPGVGIRTVARILLTTGGKDFPSAAHLASDAGLAPVTWRSGTARRGERAPRGGNKILKDALFQAAFAALHDPHARAYYTRKRTAGKTHTQALLALARRRVDILYAMIRDGTSSHPPHALPNP